VRNKPAGKSFGRWPSRREGDATWPARVSSAGLIAASLIAVVAWAGLTHPSARRAEAMVLLMRGLVYLGIVGAVCRTGERRAWWLGFFLFGWTYSRIRYYSWVYVRFPTDTVLTMLAPTFGVPLAEPPLAAGQVTPFGVPVIGVPLAAGQVTPFEHYLSIGHSLFVLMAALAGGFVAQALYIAAAAARAEANGDGTRPASHAARETLAVPCMALLFGLVLIGSTAVVGAERLAPGIWAGATYLLTWWLLALAALGACVGHGRRREFWFGAAFFGIGFMFLVHGQPPFAARESRLHVPATLLLETIRPHFETLAAAFSGQRDRGVVQNARIRAALRQRVPIHFSDTTTLADVIHYIEEATRSPDGKVIPIYVDPIGLQEAEKPLTASVTAMNLEGVTLQTSLKQCLRQLDLAFAVDGELLLITSYESADRYHY
jgi:hypothetical protein